MYALSFHHLCTQISLRDKTSRTLLLNQVLPFQKSMLFHEFNALLCYYFWHWLLISFAIDFAFILEAFWHHLPFVFVIDYQWTYDCIFMDLQPKWLPRRRRRERPKTWSPLPVSSSPLPFSVRLSKGCSRIPFWNYLFTYLLISIFHNLFRFRPWRKNGIVDTENIAKTTTPPRTTRATRATPATQRSHTCHTRD